ncbi:hypothetical protein [Bacillus timonensis]|uniref:hypothetical protein n=1 Tax=Bacillus timonensis TaxID=1033734 RepID=UPI000289D3C6|nr:hypothetical protein [Bacillus timonensis]
MNGNISVDYLESLQGKVVRVFKGGPESRLGQLLVVRPDFVVLYTNEEGVISYQTSHIKSVIEDSSSSMNTNNIDDNTIASFESVNTFSELLSSMKNNMVRIDRGGPEARNGILLDVKTDYLVLYTEKDGVVYYQLEHVKSLSNAVKNNKSSDSEDSNQQSNNSMMNNFVTPEYMEEENFSSLLKNMKYKWVTINRGGPESMQGVLAESSDDHLVLICEKEVCRLSTFHIRNISYVLKQESNQNAENSQNQQDSSEDSQNQNNNSNENESNQNNQDNNKSKRVSVKMYSGRTHGRV